MDDFNLVKVGKLLSYGFNADASCCTVSTTSGFSIYNTNPIVQRLEDKSDGIRLVEMLYCTSLLAVVPSGDKPGSSPRKIKLINNATDEVIVEVPFQSTVLSVKLNKERLVVSLESNQLHIFDLSTMNCLQVLSPSVYSGGLFALSREDTSTLAFPGASGDVILFDCVALRLLAQFSAHKSSLSQLAFNRTGSMLATASVTGTLIRVFSIPSGEPLHTFRRGMHHVTINSLSFCPRSQLLSAGSSSGTVHIFLIPGTYTNQAAASIDNEVLTGNRSDRFISDDVQIRSASLGPIDRDWVDQEQLMLDLSDEQSVSTLGTATTNTNTNSKVPFRGNGNGNGNGTSIAGDSGRSISGESAGSGRPSSGKEKPCEQTGQQKPANGQGWARFSQLQTWKDLASTTVTNAVGVAGIVGGIGIDYGVGLGILPNTAQEYVDSTRAVGVCKVPAGEAEFKAAFVMATSDECNQSVGSQGHDDAGTCAASERSSSSAPGGASTITGLAKKELESQHLKIVVVTQLGRLYRFALPSLQQLIAQSKKASVKGLQLAKKESSQQAQGPVPQGDASVVSESAPAGAAGQAGQVAGEQKQQQDLLPTIAALNCVLEDEALLLDES
jgi:autophagy-related protein 18